MHNVNVLFILLSAFSLLVSFKGDNSNALDGATEDAVVVSSAILHLYHYILIM